MLSFSSLVRPFSVVVAAAGLVAFSAGAAPAHPGGHSSESSPTGGSHEGSVHQSQEQGFFNERVTAVSDGVTIEVTAAGVMTPPRGMRVVVSSPIFGASKSVKVSGDGSWRVGFTVPIADGASVKSVPVRLQVRQRGLKKPLMSFRKSVNVDYAPAALPVPDALLPRDPAEQAAFASDASAYSFIITNPGNGQPVRWNRCAPIPVVVNPTGLPDTAMEDIGIALGELSRASGLSFIDPVVRTDLSGPSVIDGRADSARGAIAITSATPSQVPDLTDNVLGVGGFRFQGNHIAGGYVVVDSTENLTDRSMFRRVLLHELGHAINLGHVDNPGQIMYPMLTLDTPDSFQAGDIAGMNGLASFGCEASS